jgi:hypothetical protein
MVTKQISEPVLGPVEQKPRRRRSVEPKLLERLAQQDQRLFGLLLRFRAGEAVAGAIVDEVLPAVDAKARRLSPTRLYGREDLRQELIVELLQAAGTIPIRRPAFLSRRLLLDAAKRLTRRLERDWYQQLEEWYRRYELESSVDLSAGDRGGDR